MSYSTSVAPTPEYSTIASASLKSAAFGACAVTACFAFLHVLSDLTSVLHVFTAFWVLCLVFALAFAVGAIAVGISLLLIGALVARSSRQVLASWRGLMIALTLAVALSVGLGHWVGSQTQWFGFSLIALAFAFPAAIIYRREILLKRSVD